MLLRLIFVCLTFLFIFFLLGDLNAPSGIAVDPVTENYIVTDLNNHRVQILLPDGTCQYSFGGKGAEEGQFASPCGIALDPVNRTILVTDTTNHRIQVFSVDGRNLLQILGSNGTADGEFQSPWGAANVDMNNHLIIPDWGNRCLQVFE